MLYEHEFINFMPVPILVCDEKNIYEQNIEFGRVFDKEVKTIDELIEVFEKKDRGKVLDFLKESIDKGATNVIEALQIHMHGHKIDMSLHIGSIECHSRKCAIITLKDIHIHDPKGKGTEVSHKLINQEKLAGIGHLAAGVAHEIFNPLGYIKSNFDTLNEYFSDINKLADAFKKVVKEHEENELADDLKSLYKKNDMDFILADIEDLFVDVDEGMDRILNIVNGLKRFAREGDDVIEYDLNEGIKRTLTLSRNEFKYDAKLDVDYGEIPLIRAHSSKINQVVLGMIVNAVYAIKEKHQGEMGHLSIKTYTYGGYVCCKVCDDGIGISKEKLQTIYDPFYTTKPEGVGTGLGLSIAWDIIVDQHGGVLDVESEEGKGTCFTIRLPISEDLE